MLLKFWVFKKQNILYNLYWNANQNKILILKILLKNSQGFRQFLNYYLNNQFYFKMFYYYLNFTKIIKTLIEYLNFLKFFEFIIKPLFNFKNFNFFFGFKKNYSLRIFFWKLKNKFKYISWYFFNFQVIWSKKSNLIKKKIMHIKKSLQNYWLNILFFKFKFTFFKKLILRFNLKKNLILYSFIKGKFIKKNYFKFKYYQYLNLFYVFSKNIFFFKKYFKIFLFNFLKNKNFYLIIKKINLKKNLLGFFFKKKIIIPQQQLIFKLLRFLKKLLKKNIKKNFYNIIKKFSQILWGFTWFLIKKLQNIIFKTILLFLKKKIYILLFKWFNLKHKTFNRIKIFKYYFYQNKLIGNFSWIAHSKLIFFHKNLLGNILIKKEKIRYLILYTHNIRYFQNYIILSWKLLTYYKNKNYNNFLYL